MKVLLMHARRDFDPAQPLPPNEPALAQDLELDTLFRAMAGDDEFLHDVARKAVLTAAANDAETILHRQAVLKDALDNPALIRELYALAVEAIERRRKSYFGLFSNRPDSVIYGSLEALHMYVEVLVKLRTMAEVHGARVSSEGLRSLCATLRRELSDEYVAGIEAYLKELKFRDGVLISARPGAGNRGADYVLRMKPARGDGWLKRLLRRRSSTYSFRIDDRDEAGARAFSELRDRGVHLVANALGQSTEHMEAFFVALRTELAFYVGCVNLHERLARQGSALCIPQAEPPGARKLRCAGIYDVCLALRMGTKLIGNAVDGDGRGLVIITGANQGGKSSLLRGIGLAQLMMQAGMFVAAESFAAQLCPAPFTHFKREEDQTMKHGKLDEELARMSAIVDALAPDALVLFNESFAATNEREGSEIARQIVRALLEKRVRVVFVTHSYLFARGFFDEGRRDALFLRAERLPDGTRTFRLVEGEPLQTSFGEDLYRKIFAAETSAATETAEAGP